eukprot:jgi/Orpsp1_1/1190736/evm.model.d7180000080889.1
MNEEKKDKNESFNILISSNEEPKIIQNNEEEKLFNRKESQNFISVDVEEQKEINSSQSNNISLTGNDISNIPPNNNIIKNNISNISPNNNIIKNNGNNEHTKIKNNGDNEHTKIKNNGVDINEVNKENTSKDEKFYKLSKTIVNNNISDGNTLNNDLNDNQCIDDDIKEDIKECKKIADDISSVISYPHKYTAVRIFIYILIAILIIYVLIDFIKILASPADYFYGIFYPLTDDPILDIVYSTIENNTFINGLKDSIVEGLLQLDFDEYNNYIDKTHSGNLGTKIFHYFFILALTIASSLYLIPYIILLLK